MSEGMRSDRGKGACLQERDGSADVVKVTSVARRTLLTTPRDGFVSLIRCLTAFASDTTMALVEHGALPGPRQLDMGNSG